VKSISDDVWGAIALAILCLAVAAIGRGCYARCVDRCIERHGAEKALDCEFRCKS
jgi:hypothetical protein